MTDTNYTTGEKLRFTEVIMLLALAGMLCYAIYVRATLPAIETALPQNIPERALKSVLITNNGSQEVFVLAYVGTGSVLTKARKEIAGTAKLVSTTGVLSQMGSGITVFDVKNRMTIPFDRMKSPLLFTTNEKQNMSYATADENGSYRLLILCKECNDATKISVPGTYGTSKNASLKMFADSTLPLQHFILLSPFETTAALLDHAFFPRIAVVNLVERTPKMLMVPGFSDKQMHFSPLYLDNRTILFGVVDADKWATYLYHITEDRYEKFSDDFTDRAFFSATGKLVLLRSTYQDGDMNIPFGSYALYARKRGTNRTTVDRITGSGAQALAIRTLLFEKPNEEPLHFKPTLREENFYGIESRSMRLWLLSLWETFRYPPEFPQGALLIFRGTGKEDMEAVEKVSFIVDPQKQYLEYTEKIAPLLRALEVPTSLIAQYEQKRLQTEIKGQSFELTDLWW